MSEWLQQRFVSRCQLSVLALCVALTGSSPIGVARAQGQDVDAWIAKRLPEFVDFYIELHRNPEVSFEERETADRMAATWKRSGFQVEQQVGGTGVVAILKNGEGPLVMMRTDLDALPVTEQTGLAFASTKTVTAAGGSSSGVMHACGHDVHMTTLAATGAYLAEHRQAWRGTVMLIGQPAEERGSGAKAMLEAGLFARFGKPDFAVALHVDPSLAAGKVGVAGGFLMANVDSVDITVKGRGGHGSAPHLTVDPIVEAAQLVVALQTIVSREINPRKPAVITVGAIHGGTKHNIISDQCELQITVRSFDEETRQQLLSAIERKAKAIAESCAAPAPEIKVSEGTPALENQSALADRLGRVFVKRWVRIVSWLRNRSWAEKTSASLDAREYRF